MAIHYSRNPSRDWYYDVNRGDIAGVEHYHAHGENPASQATEIVYDLGGTAYNWLTASELIEVVSSSANDDLGSTGAEKVVVVGLDANWDKQEEEVILDGATPVSTMKKFLRLNRAYVSQAGSGEVNAGDITLSSASTSKDLARIRAGKGSTLMAIYSVPRYRTCRVSRIAASSERSMAVTMLFRKSGVVQVKNSFYLNANASGVERVYRVIYTIEEKTDVYCSVTGAQAGAVAVEFDLVCDHIEP